MSNKRTIPIHTANVVIAIAKGPCSFNRLQHEFRLSPSTLSRILKFLRKGGCIKATDLRTGRRSGMKKAYELTQRGKRLVPAMRRYAKAERTIIDLV